MNIGSTVASPVQRKFAEHALWRRESLQKLRQLDEWLVLQGLVDASVKERLNHLENRLRSDKILVAFVAEFSRGKSELINALFFADYGCRIMPASAGRTTMCPVELGFDANLSPGLRLLPIDTRLLPQGLAEWRARPSAWTEVALEVGNATQIARTLQKVAEVRRVGLAEARSLGFWNDALPGENPLQDPSDGSVEVPLWRHALVNLPHPLLKQGLVVLDTPGLNAVGAEPELTVNLLPQAHAVVFVLGADTGVTRSDHAIWQDHLGSGSARATDRLVVLNKIDTLWDALSTTETVQAQLKRQCSSAAQVLGVEQAQVVAVSAQKGLVAKTTGDATLLQASGLPVLEEMLSRRIVGRRQTLLQVAITDSIADLQAVVKRAIHTRRRDLEEQMLELRSLRGKNSAVVNAMRRRIEQEQKVFAMGAPRIHALRAVHHKLLQQMLEGLGANALKHLMADLLRALQQKGVKTRLRKEIAAVFARMAEVVTQAEMSAQDLQNMLAGTFRQLNAELGFSLQVPAPPSLDNFKEDLARIEQDHLRYLTGVGNALRLAQSEFAARLGRALTLRLLAVLESVAHVLDGWSNSATAQLDAQLRERQHSFVRRRTAVERIQEASGGLVVRLEEMQEGQQIFIEMEHRLHALVHALDTMALVTAVAPDPAQAGGLE